MSDKFTNEAIENKFETAASEEIFNDLTSGIANGEVGTDTTPIYEQTKVIGKSLEEKNSNKGIFAYIRSAMLTPKVCNIILIILGSLITALSVLQMVFWGLNIKDTYLNYWEAIMSYDFLNIIIMGFMALFVLVLFINTIMGIVSLAKKGHEPRFEIVSTLFSFYLFSIFVIGLFDNEVLLISNFKFAPLLGIMIGLVLVCALVKLFVEDFTSRIYPLAFSCGAIILAFVMFAQNVGNFATYSIDGMQNFQLSDLSAYHYIKSVVADFSITDITPSIESMFLEHGPSLNITEFDFDETSLVIVMQFVPIMVSNLLPFASLSLFGYLMVGLVSKNYIQYYNLQACQRISISMLVVSLFSIAATVGLYFACKMTDSQITVQFNYTNMIVTVLLCISMIVVTSLPWKIYSGIHKRRYEAYKKDNGGN